jgi:hypothetical protein
MEQIGAATFGIVLGWIVYRSLRRQATSGVSDISSVLGAIGGAAILGLFPARTTDFGWYSIGLAVGFFGYLLTALAFAPAGQRSAEINTWLGDRPHS